MKRHNLKTDNILLSYNPSWMVTYRWHKTYVVPKWGAKYSVIIVKCEEWEYKLPWINVNASLNFPEQMWMLVEIVINKNDYLKCHEHIWMFITIFMSKCKHSVHSHSVVFIVKVGRYRSAIFAVSVVHSPNKFLMLSVLLYLWRHQVLYPVTCPLHCSFIIVC